MRRINIRRIAIALVLGAIISVLIAWCPPYSTTTFHFFGWTMGRNPIAPAKAWPTRVPRDWPKVPLTQHRETQLLGEVVTYESGVLVPGSPRSRTELWCGPKLRAIRSGWPMRAMVRYDNVTFRGIDMGVDDLGLLREGVLLPANKLLPAHWTLLPYPLLPLWPGFAMNTFLYAAFAFAAMAGVSALRLRRRITQGSCVRCGYPISGLNLCPECGTAVRGAAKMPGTAAEPIGSTPV